MNFDEWQQNHEQVLGLDITGLRCSCGAREKNNCNKESTPIDGVRYGKMCVKELKEENKAFDELTAQLERDHPDEMAEAKIWAQEFIEEIKNEPNY